MPQPSIAASIVMMQALASYLDSGSGAATFVFYDDAKPASVATAANNSAKLVTCTLPEPCYKAVLVDGIELYPSDTATVIKTGTAVWARLYNGNGDGVADFAVGTDITLASTSLVLGGTLKITSIKLHPQG